jgi:hypothetical protein
VSKRKQNNHLKRAQLIGRQILKDKAVVFIQGLTKAATLLDLKTMQTRLATQNEATFIAKYAWKWAFELSVICRDQNGKEYVSSEPLFCSSAYRQGTPELIELLNDEHAKFAKTCNQLHFITLAWVARPVHDGDEVMTPEQLFKFYQSMGAFEYLSKWQADKLEKAA